MTTTEGIHRVLLPEFNSFAVTGYIATYLADSGHIPADRARIGFNGVVFDVKKLNEADPGFDRSHRTRIGGAYWDASPVEDETYDEFRRSIIHE